MKKVIISLFTLIFALAFVACGSNTDKAAKEIVSITKAFVDGAKPVVYMYKAAKTADDVKAADAAYKKLSSDMDIKIADFQKKFEKLDETALKNNAEVSNVTVEMSKATADISAAKKAAADAVKKTAKTTKK